MGGRRAPGPDLADAQVARDFDLLSIDIDGNDFHVWDALLDYHPKVVVIEFNPTIPNGVEFVQAADPTVHHSSSISSVVALGRHKGYRLVAATEYNAFFVQHQLADVVSLPLRDLDAVRTDTSWQSQIFYGFDGTAVIRGGRGLEWHGLPVPDRVRLVPSLFVGSSGGFPLWRRGLLKAWATVRRRTRDRSSASG